MEIPAHLEVVLQLFADRSRHVVLRQLFGLATGWSCANLHRSIETRGHAALIPLKPRNIFTAHERAFFIYLWGHDPPSLFARCASCVSWHTAPWRLGGILIRYIPARSWNRYDRGALVHTDTSQEGKAHHLLQDKQESVLL